MPPSQPTRPGAVSPLDTLLVLSRSLPFAKQGGLLADALDLLLDGIGCARGAAYVAASDALELVGERGLPAALRVPLARLSLTEAAWFPAQRAARTRKRVLERDFVATPGPLDRAALGLARWGQLVACPITAGRDVHGVLVFAWPATQGPDPAIFAVIETACNMMAIEMARRADEQRGAEARTGDARAARMTALGILASGFAEELGAQLAEIGRRLEEHQRVNEVLRSRLQAVDGEPRLDARAALAADPVQALRPARESTARFLSALRPTAPERLDLRVLVADVLLLAAPHLVRRSAHVRLLAAGEHLVVGRRDELMQLVLQLVLHVAGVLDDAHEPRSDPTALIPRAFTLELCRQAGHEVMTLSDAGDDAAGARSSFFEEGAPMGDAGIDLTLARQIVVAHEGHIEVGPAPGGGGVRYSVVLPVAGGEAERRAARSRLTMGPTSSLADRARPVVLWVDEDELLLEIMVQSLPELDIRVTRSAAEAMQLLTSGLRPVLVVCNVHLADRSGHELHADVAREMPRLAERFVFVSDGVVTRGIASYLISSGRPTLVRPIDVDQVRALALRDPEAPAQVRAIAPTLMDMRVVSRRAATAPEIPAARSTGLPPPAAEGSAPEGVTPPGRPPMLPPEVTEASGPGPAREVEPSAISRDEKGAAIARATAATIRREGPKRGGAVLAMLRDRGLSDAEALSTLNLALSMGLLVREAPPSAMLRVPDADPRKTVLVVDDDFDLRQTVRDILQDEGYVVDTAANGREALEVLRHHNPPRVLLLDLTMPVMDGWQLLDELGQDDYLAEIPVVVISAGKMAPRVPRGHEFLSKPLEYHTLIATIERAMKPQVSP